MSVGAPLLWARVLRSSGETQGTRNGRYGALVGPISARLSGMIREAQATDFEHVLRLYEQLHRDGPVPHDERASAVFNTILDSSWLHLFVLELDGTIVATTYLNVIPNITHSASPYAVIQNVVVDKSRRRTGLGRAIMEHTLRAAWTAGCYKAELTTGSRTPGTHAFYRECGFSADARTAYDTRPP